MIITYNKDSITIGKRKSATVRIVLRKEGEGVTLINDIYANKYFQSEPNCLNIIREPLKNVGLNDEIDIYAIVKGGGVTGQLEAIRLGIARMICKRYPHYRSTLKAAGFLTSDARIKERKKYGLRKARKAPQYSKR